MTQKIGRIKWHEEADFTAHYPCPHCQTAVSQLSMSHFSFNKPAGACPTCTGLGEILQANLSLLLDESKSIVDGGVLYAGTSMRSLATKKHCLLVQITLDSHLIPHNRFNHSMKISGNCFCMACIVQSCNNVTQILFPQKLLETAVLKVCAPICFVVIPKMPATPSIAKR